MYVEQLSLFMPQQDAVAVSVLDGKEYQARPLDPFLRWVMPNGEYAIHTCGVDMVLTSVPLKREDVRAGHEYYHYMIGDQMYSGTFVWREHE